MVVWFDQLDGAVEEEAGRVAVEEVDEVVLGRSRLQLHPWQLHSLIQRPLHCYLLNCALHDMS